MRLSQQQCAVALKEPRARNDFWEKGKTHMKSKLLLSTAIGLAFGASAFASANHTTTVAAPPAHQHQVLPSGTTHKIKGTVLNSGYFGNYGSGATLVDTETVTCKTKTTCTFALSAMIQDCNFNSVQNVIAVQATVDGNYADGGPVAGDTDYFCIVTNWQGIYGGLAAGAHTVNYYAYNGASDYIAQWSTRTDITNP
jgi:hypothetical protein